MIKVNDGVLDVVHTPRGKIEKAMDIMLEEFKADYLAGNVDLDCITVTHPDIIRYFMTIPEAVSLVLQASYYAEGGEVFVLDMGEPMKIDTLARNLIKLSGFIPDVDIKVEYTGLRPGEKLYEEVLSNTENTLETSHPRIRIAKVREYEYDYIKEEFVKLNDYAREINVDELVKLMKKIVPEYKSKNSIFEKFD